MTTTSNGEGAKVAPKIASTQPMAGLNKPASVNIIGLAKADYKGGESTLCNGCGHDSISAQIISACYELGVKPEGLHQVQRHRLLQQKPRVFHEPLARH